VLRPAGRLAVAAETATRIHPRATGWLHANREVGAY
jgi:hypothetical protein